MFRIAQSEFIFSRKAVQFAATLSSWIKGKHGARRIRDKITGKEKAKDNGRN